MFLPLYLFIHMFTTHVNKHLLTVGNQPTIVNGKQLFLHNDGHYGDNSVYYPTITPPGPAWDREKEMKQWMDYYAKEGIVR